MKIFSLILIFVFTLNQISYAKTGQNDVSSIMQKILIARVTEKINAASESGKLDSAKLMDEANNMISKIEDKLDSISDNNWNQIMEMNIDNFEKQMRSEKSETMFNVKEKEALAKYLDEEAIELNGGDINSAVNGELDAQKTLAINKFKMNVKSLTKQDFKNYIFKTKEDLKQKALNPHCIVWGIIALLIATALIGLGVYLWIGAPFIFSEILAVILWLSAAPFLAGFVTLMYFMDSKKDPVPATPTPKK